MTTETLTEITTRVYDDDGQLVEERSMEVLERDGQFVHSCGSGMNYGAIRAREQHSRVAN